MTEPITALEAQYNLPLEEQKKLVVLPQGISQRAIPELVTAAVALARSASIPLWGITFIPSRSGQAKAYINADGIRFALANDERKVASNKIISFTQGKVKGDTCTVIREVTMGNGQTYQGIGSVVIDDQWNPANATLKADTKAARRASYDAIANSVGMPQWDEDADKNTFVDADFHEVIDAPKTVVKFLSSVTSAEMEQIGVSEDQIEKQMLPELWQKILEVRKANG